MEAALTLADIVRHVRMVEAVLEGVAHRLRMRGLLHDQSKFRPDEFAAFTEINQVARENSFMSSRYKSTQGHQALALHYGRNPHHPEHHPEGVGAMDLITLIEMVADWRAAFLLRTETGVESMGWEDSLAAQAKRYQMTDEQFDLICLVADFVTGE